jgi:cyanophycinase
MKIGTRLMVFGGGPLSKEAISRFRNWAERKRETRILIVAWASEEPELTVGAIAERFAPHGVKTVAASLRPPVTDAERVEFLAELAGATAVFFSGGDQNRIARATDHPAIREALHEAYRSGVPFAGTSAGTAIMSLLMFAGDGDPGALDSSAVRLARGLGLCEGVIFDQHFLKRQRQNRLFAAILRHPEFVGVGVDEGSALEILDGRRARVHGPEKVMRVEKAAKSRSLSVEVYHAGESFDLFAGMASSELAYANEAAS